VATKYVNDDASQGIQMTRPICPLPDGPDLFGRR
jgi:hypothetical protein